uniref:Molybdate-anion transporter n=1 Tax=Panagrolaimus sp. ES5 TaxID=591445 RepID=A0AC34GRT2_9BILA
MLFTYSLYGLAAACALLHLYTRSKSPAVEDAQFLGFQRSYLTVYLLAVAGDWLQGPHVYALYQYYGMSKHEIEQLFIAGFGSSLLFGTFIGSFADKFSFEILMLGRLLGGIATSILFSAFESWLVFEHNKRGFNDNMLSTIFSHATLGNSLVAICAGVVAQTAADMFGFVAPFDVALSILCLMAILLVMTWPENYGDSKAALHTSFVNAYKTIRQDTNVLYLGLVQSLFEGVMYTFVLEWTPALTEANTENERIPHGLIFAAFMVAVMMGSSMFKLLSNSFSSESFLRVVLLVASFSLVIPIILPSNAPAIFAAFIVFEICVGIFWPAMGYLRGKYIPEETRSTTMNFFRVPLNIIVIAILYQNFSMNVIFQFCVGLLFIATIVQFAFCLNCKKQGVRYSNLANIPLTANEEKQDMN